MFPFGDISPHAQTLSHTLSVHSNCVAVFKYNHGLLFHHEKQLENRFLILLNLAGQNGTGTMETEEQQ